jgi:hypothetical protein
MAAICVPMMRLPTQGKEYMPKTTTIDPCVLEMALVGYELERNRIEAAIAEIQSQLGDGDAVRSISTATASAKPKTTRKKRFSAAARKRMAAAHKKRWNELKAKKALAKKTQPTAPVKRQKATAAAPARKRPVQLKAAKKAAPKAKAAVRAARKATVKKVAAQKPKADIATLAPPQITNGQPAFPVQATAEPTSAVTTE